MIAATTALVGRDGLAGASLLAKEIASARAAHAPSCPERDRGTALAERALDATALARAAMAVAEVLERQGALSADEAAAVREVDLASHLGPLLDWATGRSPVAPFAAAPIAWSVVRLALPAFVGSSGPREEIGSEGGCPECGMAPDLATLGATGARRLVCGACDTEWRFDRLRCPFCGTGAQDQLGYLAGGVSGAVIRVCDACGCYLKTIDRRSLSGDETPLLLRLVSTEMDVSAERAGYHPAG